MKRIEKTRLRNSRWSNERGLSLVEVLVVYVLFAATAVTLMNASAISMKTRTRVLHHSIASQLALERSEEFAALDPETYSATEDNSETIERSGVPFVRTTQITVNPDNSRTVVVSVASENSLWNGNASIANTYAVWGTQ